MAEQGEASSPHGSSRHTAPSSGDGSQESLSRLAEEIFSAAEYSESQFLRHSDKAGVTDNAKLYTRQCLKNLTDELANAAAGLESQVEQQAQLLNRMQGQAALLAQTTRMQQLSSAAARSQECVTWRPSLRSDKTIDMS
mmetsp:Transcript_9975/g.28646  ORF Transcript_9975/g.28646 Transcript_9975/m.28646 type:complete len:139 (-) Transcript_9975:1692-2108(-)